MGRASGTTSRTSACTTTSAQLHRAHAGDAGFAVGRDVVLSDPGDERLLAHELAHVVQQERSGPTGDPERGARLAEQGDVSLEPARRGAGLPRAGRGGAAHAGRVRLHPRLDPLRADEPLLARRSAAHARLTPPVLLPPPVLPGGPILPPLTAPSTTGTPPTSAASTAPVAPLGCIVRGLQPRPAARHRAGGQVDSRRPRRRSRSRSGGARS